MTGARFVVPLPLPTVSEKAGSCAVALPSLTEITMLLVVPTLLDDGVPLKRPDDVLKIWRSMLEPGDPYKYLDQPLSNYTSASYDRIMLNGKQVGLNMFSGYSYNERSYLSLGIVDANVELGTEVKLVWGEEGGGTRKTTVERHKQIEVRAKVSPAPYSKQAQTTYHEGWRTKATA